MKVSLAFKLVLSSHAVPCTAFAAAWKVQQGPGRYTSRGHGFGWEPACGQVDSPLSQHLLCTKPDPCPDMIQGRPRLSHGIGALGREESCVSLLQPG